MHIAELDQYSLKDAVKFHNSLNPRLWGQDEHLLPEVRRKLLAIAADFQEFLGVPELDVKDITVSGSNAAYSYTPTSDIDLHLVVQMPADHSEVYQELFNAKKYQYNDEHDIRIGGADVELYVQPADQAHVSQGIYSVRDGKWLQVPRRRKIDIDDHCVAHKTQDLQARIEQAIESGEQTALQRLWDKIKTMRQTGLESAGEFGCDNLVFKMLRRSGHIEQLKQAKIAAHDRELSLQERKKKKKKVRYGFGGYWYPGFGFGGEAGEGGGGDGGGESMREGHYGSSLSSEDGVAPSTQLFLNETDQQEVLLQDFIKSTADKLGIEQLPNIVLHRDDDWGVDNHSFGRYEPETHTLHVNLSGRHIMDVFRTTAHELAHCRQHELDPLPSTAGATGSPWENEAHAAAGIIMRDWADSHPEMFDSDSLEESASGYIPKNRREAQMPQYAMALSKDIRPGQTGTEANKLALKTGRNGEPTLLMKTVNLREGRVREMDSLGNQDVTGPETPPTMPKGTVRVDVSDLYDWYKLGQHISNMKGLGKHDFGQGAPSAIVSFGDEDTEHKYIKDLEATGLDVTDIDPRDPNQPPGMRKIKTDPTYNVDEEEDLVESLRREFELLEDEVLGEIKMSPSNLRAEAAKTGAMAGMEFEMIVPNISNPDDDVEYEPNYDMDERCRSIDQAVDFFHDGDYNGRRDVERLRERMRNDYEEWVMEQVDNNWDNDKEDIIRNYVQENVDPAEWWALVNDNTSKEEAFEQFVGDIVDDSDNDYHQQALDEFREEKYQDYDENDWLSDQDLDLMSNIESAYEISWPHWHEESRGGAADIDAVADSFSEAIGRPVNASSSYHGARREAGKYVVEPDGSLDPDDSNDTGLEFVSPPLPLDELLSDLNRVKKWADQTGCYTNKSTGLHINISVPDYDRTRLDYVKLALLLGDQYVLDQFGRSSNTYAKSAMGKVQDIIRQYPTKAQHVLDKMRGHMDDFATKAIHSGSTDKYTSINTKEGYIEFRSPGGDWLDANFDKIENTLMRFTVALSAAMDPEAYREEYQKKLYKLLTQNQDKANTDTIRHFADYVAGKIPQAALRSFVKQAQLQRQISKEKQPGKKYWWRVYKDGKGAANSAILELVASSKAEAIDLAGREWGLFSREYRNIMDAEPVRPYEEKPAIKPVATGPQRDYEIVNLANRTVVERFRASSDEEAQEYFDRIIAPGDQLFYDVRPAPAAQPAAPQQTSTHTYRAFDLRNNQTLGTFQGGEPGSDSAAEAFADMLAREGISAQYADYELLGQERQRPQPTAQAAPQQSSGEFTGNWLIQDPQGRTIHRFGGVGNVQSDANRAAITWLRAHPGSMQAGVTVVPEMQ